MGRRGNRRWWSSNGDILVNLAHRADEEDTLHKGVEREDRDYNQVEQNHQEVRDSSSILSACFDKEEVQEAKIHEWRYQKDNAAEWDSHEKEEKQQNEVLEHHKDNSCCKSNSAEPITHFLLLLKRSANDYTICGYRRGIGGDFSA